ncbi:MAG TPA: BadF/BadG/BcrA/BcrD ATPase family protein [Candidatus Angelobacter sp.]|jgi:N-acetylglucosamine kinase-like BadF-type ATPase|nr:BadF/BadG/BcrA/BcrD ATPase family protein [Candidatus Angelobacter sp.]
MPLYLGIDAGGTKTDCAVSNGAELLGQATGASCKLARVGKERGKENLQTVIRQATDTAHVDAGKIQHVCIGMAGASLAEAVHWAQQTIRELMPESTIYVAGDHVIAHRAAFGTSPGVLVISGTGSIAFGRNQNGETARAGGWGPNVSDEGSAFWVGREAVTAALHAFDFGESNGLLATIAECWKVAPEEVIRLANSSEPRFPELAGPVVNAAEQGDASARAITDRAGKALAGLASAVINRLWPVGGIVPVALAGGVLQGSPLVRQAFKEAMKTEQPQAAVSFAFVRPVLGALEIAAQRGVRR